MEYILTFDSTNMAIKAERSLLEINQKVSVMPLPSQIKAGCGISLRIKNEGITKCFEILKENQIEDFVVHRREIDENKNYKYERVSMP
ncbi:MAG: DUF3343 domain-containing protein [Firmicutes bacterium]|nr:DUF3343 domain-containing protein [Bacillota bacterium]